MRYLQTQFSITTIHFRFSSVIIANYKFQLRNFLNFHIMRREDFEDNMKNVTSENGTYYYPHAPSYDDFTELFTLDATGKNFVYSDLVIERIKNYLGKLSLGEGTIETVSELVKLSETANKETDTWDSLVQEWSLLRI